MLSSFVLNVITKCVLGFRLRQNLTIYLFKLFKLLAGITEFEEEMILDNSREFTVKFSN